MNFDLFIQMRIDWAIIGGESGNDTGKYLYRPCKLEWIREIISDIQTLTPVFVKQLGTHLAKELNLKDRLGGNYMDFRMIHACG